MEIGPSSRSTEKGIFCMDMSILRVHYTTLGMVVIMPAVDGVQLLLPGIMCTVHLPRVPYCPADCCSCLWAHAIRMTLNDGEEKPWGVGILSREGDQLLQPSMDAGLCVTSSIDAQEEAMLVSMLPEHLSASCRVDDRRQKHRRR